MRLERLPWGGMGWDGVGSGGGGGGQNVLAYRGVVQPLLVSFFKRLSDTKTRGIYPFRIPSVAGRAQFPLFMRRRQRMGV